MFWTLDEVPFSMGVSRAAQPVLTCRGWCLLWDSCCGCGCLTSLGQDPRCLQLDTKHQGHLGKSWAQLLLQGVWHWWLWGCMWWCSGQLDWIWASIFAPCLFSNGFPVLFGEHQQIPQVPIERAAVFYWKGEDFISQYVYMWNDEWHKDYWKNQSGINVLADKIAVSKESGVNFY